MTACRVVALPQELCGVFGSPLDRGSPGFPGHGNQPSSSAQVLFLNPPQLSTDVFDTCAQYLALGLQVNRYCCHPDTRWLRPLSPVPCAWEPRTSTFRRAGQRKAWEPFTNGRLVAFSGTRGVRSMWGRVAITLGLLLTTVNCLFPIYFIYDLCLTRRFYQNDGIGISEKGHLTLGLMIAMHDITTIGSLLLASLELIRNVQFINRNL